MKKTLLTALVLACASFAYAQKESSKALVVEFVIDPATPEPTSPVSYITELKTPIDPLAWDEEPSTDKAKTEEERKAIIEKAKNAKWEELRKQYLVISGGKYVIKDNAEALTLKLETSAVTITNATDKPVNDLKAEDALFNYKYSAILTTTDKNGNVVWSRTLSSPDQEHAMTKGQAFFNTSYKIKMRLYKNNPEKLKKFNDRFLEKKSHIILYEIIEMAQKAIVSNYELQVKSFTVGLFSVKGKAYNETSDISDKIFDTNSKFHALSKKNRLPKEEMDKVMREGITVWEKYIAKKSELDEKAYKGLLLNCALAYSWLNEFDKAAEYLNQVPETKKENIASVEDVEDDNDGPPRPMGATVILSFPTQAANMRNVYEIMSEYKERAVIRQ